MKHTPRAEIVLERSGDWIYLFVNSEIIRRFRAGRTYIGGKPFEIARAIEESFAVAHVEVSLEIVDDTLSPTELAILNGQP